MEETSKKEKESDQRTPEVVHFSNNPCLYIQEAFKGLLKCLGFDESRTHDQPSSSNTTSTTKGEEEGDPSSNEDPPPAEDDPATDPPTSTSVGDAAAALRATPPRPSINPGRGPQTN